MCGIIGFVNGENTSIKDAGIITQQLLWADALRGFDSTGIIFAEGEKMNYYKRGLTSPDFVRTITFDKYVKPALDRSRVVIGHNRAATKTAVSDENAHPFFSNNGKIGLVHNGFIENANGLLPNGVWVTVDSAAVPLVMEDKGEKGALELLRGAYSLAWYNKEDQTLNLARNSKRELFIGYVKGKNQLFFGSEWLMVHWILARNGVEVEEWKAVPVGEHLKFKANNPRNGVERSVFQLPPNTTPSIRGVMQGSGTGTGATTGGTAQGIIGRGATDHLSPTKRAECFMDQIEHLSRAEQFRAGIPKSKEKLRKLAIRLSDMGYRLGETVGAKLDSFSLYKNQEEMGVGFGSRLTNDNVLVRVPGLKKKDFERLKAMRLFYGLCVGVEVTAEKKVQVICVPTSDTQGANYDDYFDDEIPTEDSTVVLSNGDTLTYTQFLKQLKEGCSWCSGNLDPAKAKEFVWIDKSTCLCDECTGDEVVMASFNFNRAVSAIT